MDLRGSEQIEAVLADAIQPREDALVVHALALDVEEGPLAERMPAGDLVAANADWRGED